MHDWPLVHLDDGFRGWWPIAECTVRPLGVVVFSPGFDYDLSLSHRVEQFTVQQLVREPGVEALHIAVLPTAAQFDKGGLRTDCCDPITNRPGNELGAIVAAHKCRRPSQNEEIGESVDHVGRVQLLLHPDRQAFPAEFI